MPERDRIGPNFNSAGRFNFSRRLSLRDMHIHSLTYNYIINSVNIRWVDIKINGRPGQPLSEDLINDKIDLLIDLFQRAFNLRLNMNRQVNDSLTNNYWWPICVSYWLDGFILIALQSSILLTERSIALISFAFYSCLITRISIIKLICLDL